MGEARALEELLIGKGLITAEAMRQGIEAMDAPSSADGARLVARCWVDPAFEARMLESVNAAAKELGLNLGQTPIHALKDTPQVHHVIVCTLCSCPSALLGEKPDWYKSRAYRSRIVREPRTVLEEFGTHALRGRNRPYGRPPAQTPACSFSAPGSSVVLTSAMQGFAVMQTPVVD